MKFLIVGLGSMGKRRVRNLQYLKAGEILGFDPRPDRRQEAEEKYRIKTFENMDQAWRQNPDVLIISTSPDLHTAYAIEAAKRGKHFFTEASVVSDDLETLIDLCKDRNIVAAPSCTMRYYPGPKKVREILTSGEIGAPLAFTYHTGQYLPDWHPWEDIKSFYVSRRATGGAREIVPFELVWLIPIFGAVLETTCLKGKVSDLDADIDDLYHILLRFQNGIIGHLCVDVISRAPVRRLTVLGSEGNLEWDASQKLARVYSAGTRQWEDHSIDAGTVEKMYINPEEPYIEEMRLLIGAIQGSAPFPYTLEEDKEILDLLREAERSSETGRHLSPVLSTSGTKVPVHAR